MRQRVPIVAVTGTKGKTTVVRVLDDLIRKRTQHVLRVDTTGAYINGTQKIGLEESLNFTGLVPTVAPGKFLPFLYLESTNQSHCAAVLEAALGSSARPGMGYKNHKVGVFTNVLEDHIGSSSRIQSRQDIADAKEFIFARIDLDGWAVINADDELVMQKVAKIPAKNEVKHVYCSVVKSGNELPSGAYSCYYKNGMAVLRTPDCTEIELVDAKDISWTFGAAYTPSLYNLLFVCAAYYGFYDGDINAKELAENLKAIVLDEEGGRLTRFMSSDGVTVLADYAHEKYSLKLIGELAHELAGEGGKVIGVLRLAYDRSDELIYDTANYIAHTFDSLIIYDKIDGHLKSPVVTDARKKFQQEVGKISSLFSDALSKHGARHVERIMREDEAIARAAVLANPGDVVVEIVNDDIARSIQFLKENFKNLRRVS